MGRQYLLERYPGCIRNTAVFRLGTDDFGTGKYTPNRKAHIVSCANIIPLKQIDLLAKAFKYIEREVLWTHIGEGPLKEMLMEIASDAGSHLEFHFTGQLDRARLMEFYRDTPVDLFVNTSLSEGVPVSVMEALSFGIPVIATDVGGTREIADNEVGLLVSPGISAEDLARVILEMLDSPNYQAYRKNARQRWQERCQAKVLFSDFANFLKDY
jgi:glycosyltransferase involved in cell wall biosynthesis